MKKLLILFFIPILALSQQKRLSESLFAEYETYKEPSLTQREFTHSDIEPLIKKLKTEEGFSVRTLGKSIQNRSISMISIGSGKTNILLWSQMHGDESTATMAIFDIFNYLKKNKKILNDITLHFIPMLNPDGAEVFKRRNAIGIDLNRDALRLQSPESKILKAARDSLQADFGFNLHDQSKYYNTEKTNKPATISYLAPAYNYAKSINKTRKNAMKIIIQMNDIIQQYAPGQVGRYSDDFEPRAFGDNIQKWGTSTILIESGGYKNDPEKQFIRKLNFVSILAAIQSISIKSYENISIKKYDEIPKNDRKLFDVKFTNIAFTYLRKNYTVDLGINTNKIESNSYQTGLIIDKGDLSTYYGYQTIDGKGLTFNIGKAYPKILSNTTDFEKLNCKELLQQGYTSVVFDSIPENINLTKQPIKIMTVQDVVIKRENTVPNSPLQLGSKPTFLLTKGGKLFYAVIDGFVYDFTK
ncbi:MAG: M14 family metallopeptidase [Flavobacteriaceae bacterium]|nr:M14 family metallopeptidase [Flavobacteriaceae bacterium]